MHVPDGPSTDVKWPGNWGELGQALEGRIHPDKNHQDACTARESRHDLTLRLWIDACFQPVNEQESGGGQAAAQSLCISNSAVLRLGTTEEPQSFWDAELSAPPHP